MYELYLVALLLVGVIGANVLKQFLPKIPEAFILIATGWGLSFIPIFKQFQLEPEFFMLLIIAPLMFIDGQKQSFNKIRKRFQGIFLLSVVLAVLTAAVVGVVAHQIEAQWTLPLAIALAAIVTPTDAVAVKSLTGNNELPGGVGEALELESLFNDATGLVMLDLALSVLSRGTFSVVDGIGHFLFVAVGGILIGIAGGFLLVMLRFNLNMRGKNPELTTIPISLLTPFAIYLLAEHFGTSGILAVVATGIEHNWEANRLRLTSTNVQLTSRTIWNIVTDVLNDVVFLILGLSLPTVFQNTLTIGWLGTVQLIGISLLIYLIMLGIRYFWALRGANPEMVTFFGRRADQAHRFNAQIFAISGVHGTVTLAMALSLPTKIAGHTFPYRNELIMVAMFVILISMIVSALVLPRKLPEKAEAYTLDDLNHIRNKMVDYAILQIRGTIEDHATREAVTAQLQSQKQNNPGADRIARGANYQQVLGDTKEVMDTFIHGDYVSDHYSAMTIKVYNNILQHSLTNTTKPRLGHRMKKSMKHAYREVVWHTAHGVITKRQKSQFRQRRLEDDPQYSKKVQQWQTVRLELLALNDDVTGVVDQYLDRVLKTRLEQKFSDNDHIYMARNVINHFFDNVKHEYRQEAVVVDGTIYMRAFQCEYDFIQKGLNDGFISQTIASTLYTEINQAQLLQTQQLALAE